MKALAIGALWFTLVIGGFAVLWARLAMETGDQSLQMMVLGSMSIGVSGIIAALLRDHPHT